MLQQNVEVYATLDEQAILMGTIPIPWEMLIVNNRVAFAVRPKKIDMNEMLSSIGQRKLMMVVRVVKRKNTIDERNSYLALDSDMTAMDVLERVPGFVKDRAHTSTIIREED